MNDEDGEKKEVKCLDVDTVSQVKEKILDSIYRNRPYSARQNAQQVDLGKFNSKTEVCFSHVNEKPQYLSHPSLPCSAELPTH